MQSLWAIAYVDIHDWFKLITYTWPIVQIQWSRDHMCVTMWRAAIKQVVRSTERISSFDEIIKFSRGSERFMLLAWHMSYRNDFTEGF